MEIRVLKYFLAIAEEENITRAAAILHVTQPTLSRQIMQLEDELGVKLFQRSRYSIRLTDDGRFLKKRAEEILTLADRTVKAIGSREKEIAGKISIGCTETHGMEELAVKMRKFRLLHPAVSYRVHTANVDSIRESMERGVTEIGLLTEPADTEGFVTMRLKGQEKWGALVRSDSPLAALESVQPCDLQKEPLIIPSRREIKYTLESWFRCSETELDIASHYNLGRNVAVMVRSGLGAGIGLDLFSGYSDLSFVPMSPALVTGSLLCWKRNNDFTPVTGAFIDFLRKEKEL